MEELAEKYGIKSANFVAQEVLYEFTDFWVQLQEVKANEKKRLMNALLLKDSPKRRTG